MIFLYRFLTFLLFPIFIIILYFRSLSGKEDKLRFLEKISVRKNSSLDQKKVFWIHAASIGETNSVLPLIREIIKKDNKISVLLTTTTYSSSQLINKSKFNRNNFQHRFFTLDIKFLVKKFLDHWQPEIAMFVDSEVWPNYLIELSNRKTPLILLNGRITMKTLNRWKKLPNLSRKLFNLYDLCLPSSKESEKNLNQLGAKNIKYLGNLKFCSDNKFKDDRDDLKKIFKESLICCAASTHPGEEEIIFDTHMNLKKGGVKVITIIIPRHISRSQEILKSVKNLKLNGKIINYFNEISNENEILIINTIGEMTKYFYNCKSIFMGKSFSQKLISVGGQNPIEPAKCGCKIYHGPFVSNFKEIYEFLNHKRIAKEVINSDNLTKNLLEDYNDKSSDLDKKIIKELDEYGKEILSLTLKEIFKLKKC